jgi:serine/threonine protein kinase
MSDETGVKTAVRGRLRILSSDPPMRRPTLATGTRVGRFELVRPLAVGGMAELYLAKAIGIEGFEKPVVLKRIKNEHASDGEYIRMFLDEARLAATMHHPNIVQVFDIGQGATTRDYFYAMEYVDGPDVHRILKTQLARGGPLPLSHAITIAMGVAAGLHHAHERTNAESDPLGVVHRDVSPSNVLVSREGCVKICDFGIAQGEHRSSITRVGLLKGKLAYMSPEQCRGEPLDRRSDIFSLGILLYELTVGERPFPHVTDVALAVRIASEDAPSPRTRIADYPRDLERIVLRALARDRTDRHPDARAFQVELEALARDRQLECSPLALSDYIARVFGGRSEPGFVDENATTTAPGPTIQEAQEVETLLRPKSRARPHDFAGFARCALRLRLGARALPRSVRRTARLLPHAPHVGWWLAAGVAAISAFAALKTLEATPPQPAHTEARPAEPLTPAPAEAVAIEPAPTEAVEGAVHAPPPMRPKRSRAHRIGTKSHAPALLPKTKPKDWDPDSPFADDRASDSPK